MGNLVFVGMFRYLFVGWLALTHSLYPHIISLPFGITSAAQQQLAAGGSGFGSEHRDDGSVAPWQSGSSNMFGPKKGTPYIVLSQFSDIPTLRMFRYRKDISSHSTIAGLGFRWRTYVCPGLYNI